MEQEKIITMLEQEEAVIADGLDSCIIGITDNAGMAVRAVYSAQKVVELLMQRDGMTEEEAQEFYSFNIA